MTTLLSSCPQWLFITPLVLPVLGPLIAPEEWGGDREVAPWVIHRSLRTPHGQSLAFRPLLPSNHELVPFLPITYTGLLYFHVHRAGLGPQCKAPPFHPTPRITVAKTTP